jgi:hypothetical protein
MEIVMECGPLLGGQERKLSEHQTTILSAYQATGLRKFGEAKDGRYPVARSQRCKELTFGEEK